MRPLTMPHVTSRLAAGALTSLALAAAALTGAGTAQGKEFGPGDVRLCDLHRPFLLCGWNAAESQSSHHGITDLLPQV
jgi:hypothetical protein